MKDNKKEIEKRYNKPFPKMLREIREKNNLSQDDVAKAINTQRQTISRYELGITAPDIYTIEKIVDFFNEKCKLNYSIDYWLGKEKITRNVKKEELPLSSEAIEILKKFNANNKKTITLEILLKQEDFLEKLSDYIVSGNLCDITRENSELKKIINAEKVDEVSIKDKKYSYYDIQEGLLLLQKYQLLIPG